MVIAFFLSPSGMRGGDRASAVGGVGGDWGVGEKMCANVARTKRKARTKATTCINKFSVKQKIEEKCFRSLKSEFCKQKSHSSRQSDFVGTVCRTMIVVGPSQCENKKAPATGGLFVLAPPVGLEPTTP